jgi:hypothetical protein
MFPPERIYGVGYDLDASYLNFTISDIPWYIFLDPPISPANREQHHTIHLHVP